MKLSRILYRAAAIGLTVGVVGGLSHQPAVHVEATTATQMSVAPSQVTINYVPGYGIAMWSTYMSNRQVVGHTLPHGSVWKVFKVVEADGQKWYNLGGNQWVSGQYLLEGNRASVQTGQAVNGQVTVSYFKNGSIAVWNNFATGRQPTGKLLRNGTVWKTTQKATFAGETWYNVGGQQWLQGKYVKFTDFNVTRVLGVPFIDQYANGAPYGCEGASALEAMHYKGRLTKWNLQTLLKTMPIAKDNNPYHGFAGSPYGDTPGVHQTIFPQAFDSWIAKYNPVKDISGGSLDTIIAQVQSGNPVVAWVTIRFGAPQYQKYFWGTGVKNLHVMAVDGYNKQTAQVHVSDPVLGKYWVSYQAFKQAYAPYKFAVAIL
ncbi:C39 family peptidase [Lacticaseibacillus brantae]|uniref:Peptidase C39-like domain-containing protein n=1 Tax=Lacticaseibacillus brantae DSM 23927 TaxID=1423727 RepID=A0A0R2AZ72_9LACO|nr:C39 family peptidase [Lacticaseibacillus brantae]KRM72239.1 hypothetical protein FC34_GL001224 [Lacticaseibacillus brantae DSM 23927]